MALRSNVRGVWLALSLVACTGELTGTLQARPSAAEPVQRPDTHAPTPPPAFTCRADAEPATDVVQRLTTAQYRAVLADLLALGLDGVDLELLWNAEAVRTALAALPHEGTAAGAHLVYDSMDQSLSVRLVEPQVDLATAIGQFVVDQPARLERFVRAFAPGCTGSEACVSQFIDGFGARALRRPLDDDDRRHYRRAYDGAAFGQYRGLIAAFLLAPDFIFRAEFRGEPDPDRPTTFMLTPSERANRLSFALTNSMPDEALLRAAQAGFTGAGNSLEAQATRLLETPGAERQLENFFRQWLRADRIPGTNVTIKTSGLLSLAYPGSELQPLGPDVDLERLRADAFEELVTLATFTSRRGSLSDLLTSRTSFATTPELAQLYGVPVWNKNPEALIELPEGQRAGVFTRAGFLFSGFPETRPILRGARIRLEYLCDHLEPPANVTPPENAPRPEVPTTRATTEAHTQVPGTACQGCHQTLINPLGFALEDYDALGRKRGSEWLSGRGFVPIDATSAPDPDRLGDDTKVTGGVALSARLARSSKLSACFARHAFRYLVGREEHDREKDACTLEAAERAAREGSIKDVFRVLATDEGLTVRHAEPEVIP